LLLRRAARQTYDMLPRNREKDEQVSRDAWRHVVSVSA
jgi:hypothetical protein